MALALQESNCPDTLADLNVVLGCKYIRIQYNLSVKQKHYPASLSGRMIGPYNSYYYNSSSDIELDLKFYIDQKATLSKEDLFISIENKLCEMLQVVDGVFTQRSIIPYGESKATTVGYSIKLSDYDNFVSKLNKMARSQVDREFTKVLEAKLIED